MQDYIDKHDTELSAVNKQHTHGTRYNINTNKQRKLLLNAPFEMEIEKYKQNVSWFEGFW